jgi:hypothetical protein
MVPTRAEVTEIGLLVSGTNPRGRYAVKETICFRTDALTIAPLDGDLNAIPDGEYDLQTSGVLLRLVRHGSEWRLLPLTA